MDYFETLIGHAQFSVALAGFTSLMLGLTRGRKSAVLSAWAARVVVIVSFISAISCVVTLGLLSTSLDHSQVWVIASVIFVAISLAGMVIVAWDTRRVYETGIREKNPPVTVLCWLMVGVGVGSNLANTVVQEPSFFYLYGGLVFASLISLLLFIQNIVLLSNDPSKS